MIRSVRDHASLISLLFLLAIGLAGCAGLSIPAPDAPVKAMSGPPVRESTISLPVVFSVSSIMNSLGFPEYSADRERNARIAGKIRGFFERQGLRKENLARNPLLRQQIGKAWDALQKPVRLRNDWSLYLHPRAVSLSMLSEEGDMIHLVVDVAARPLLVAGQAAAPRTPQPLPALSISDRPQGRGFHIALAVELPYDRLAADLMKSLKGKTFHTAGHAFTVKALKLYGSGESVVVAATVSGGIRGTLYLAGEPAYDQASRTFSLKNVEYTLDTAQVLVKAADWMLHSDLRETVARRAVWHADDSIGQATAELTKALNSTLNDQVSLSGTVQSVEPQAVGLTQTGITVLLEAAGSVQMNLL